NLLQEPWTRPERATVHRVSGSPLGLSGGRDRGRPVRDWRASQPDSGLVSLQRVGRHAWHLAVSDSLRARSTARSFCCRSIARRGDVLIAPQEVGPMRRELLAASTVCMACVIGMAAPAGAQRLDVIWARQAPGATITLDGVLNEPAWA